MIIAQPFPEMPQEELPEDIKNLIRESINSIEQLEILLYVHESTPTPLESASVAKALYLSPESTERQLDRFFEKRLINRTAERPITYYVESRESPTGGLVRKLASLYRERRIAIIQEIFSNPISTLQTFADAFIIGKRKE